MKINCAYTRLVAIDQIKPNPRNPNRHPDEQIDLLAKIIRETGWRSPIVVSNLSGYVVKGHGRLAAARALGFAEVPVDFQDYDTPAQETADLIADNQIAELSETSAAAINELMIDIDASGYNIDLLAIPDARQIIEATRKTFDQAAAQKIDLGTELGDAAFFNAMTSHADAELPIIPIFSEHHTAFIILCDNRIDEAFIREKLNLDRPRASYADVKRVTPNIINASEVIETWK